MLQTTSVREAYHIPFRSFCPFVLISFGLAWGILGVYIFVPQWMEALFGQLTGNHPLFFLAVYAPAIASFILVVHHGGFAGMRRFLGRALLWRCSMAWYAFLVIGIPLIFIVGSAMRGNLFTEPFPYDTYLLIVVAVLVVWWNRMDMLMKEGAVREVIPLGKRPMTDQDMHPDWNSAALHSRRS